jgi:hypothetical protein
MDQQLHAQFQAFLGECRDDRLLQQLDHQHHR